jgi:hypothetical protein
MQDETTQILDLREEEVVLLLQQVPKAAAFASGHFDDGGLCWFTCWITCTNSGITP